MVAQLQKRTQREWNDLAQAHEDEFDHEFNPTGTLRHCGWCGKTKNLSRFNKDDNHFSGYSINCRDCEAKEQTRKNSKGSSVQLLEADPKKLIVFKNGIFNVENYMATGNSQLYPHTPALFITDCVSYDFDPKARSQLYEDTINDIFSGDEECIRTWHQWLGYNLLPDMTQEKLMLLIGNTRSGKSTLIDVLRSVLSESQCISTSYSALANRFGCSPLVNKLAATIGDVRMPRKDVANVALDVLLKVTGGDSVPIEPKFQPQYDAYLKCRFTIAMNNLPTFSDSARAFVARSIILHLPNSYLGRENIRLKKDLKEEAANGKLINYALDGLKDLNKQGGFINPKSSKPFIESLEEITAPVSAFVKECCMLDDEDPTFYSVKDQLFDAWKAWCQKSNRSIGSREYFCRHLRQACPTVDGFRPQLGNKRVQAFKGIKLQDWVYGEYLDAPQTNLKVT